MADSDSDSEVQFNARSGAGEGAERNSDQEKIPSGVDADSQSVGDVSQQSTPVRREVPENKERRRRYLREPEGRRSFRQDMPGLRFDDLHIPVTSRAAVPTMRPDTYTGEEDWESYITHFEICAELGRWSPREMTLTLAASLRGQARIFYMNLAGRQRSTYRELAAELEQRFGGVRQKTTWISKLESRTHHPEETFAAFGDDIMRLAQRAHSDLPVQAQEAIALNQLYKSVVPEMKYRCISAQCQTVSQAVDMIQTYENIMQDQSANKKPRVRMAAQVEEPVAEPSTTQIMGAIKELSGRIDRLEQRQRPNRSSEPRLCYICQSPDHFMRNCPNHDKRSQRGNQSNAGSRPNNHSEGGRRQHSEN